MTKKPKGCDEKSKIRSKGQGRGLGTGKGEGPIGVPIGKKRYTGKRGVLVGKE